MRSGPSHTPLLPAVTTLGGHRESPPRPTRLRKSHWTSLLPAQSRPPRRLVTGQQRSPDIRQLPSTSTRVVATRRHCSTPLPCTTCRSGSCCAPSPRSWPPQHSRRWDTLTSRRARSRLRALAQAGHHGVGSPTLTACMRGWMQACGAHAPRGVRTALLTHSPQTATPERAGSQASAPKWESDCIGQQRTNAVREPTQHRQTTASERKRNTV